MLRELRLPGNLTKGNNVSEANMSGLDARMCRVGRRWAGWGGIARERTLNLATGIPSPTYSTYIFPVILFGFVWL